MCQFCEVKEPLDSVAEEWLMNEENIDLGGLGHLMTGLAVLPESKKLDFTLHHVVDDIFGELYATHIPIKYCPICGREL